MEGQGELSGGRGVRRWCEAAGRGEEQSMDALGHRVVKEGRHLIEAVMLPRNWTGV